MLYRDAVSAITVPQCEQRRRRNGQSTLIIHIMGYVTGVSEGKRKGIMQFCCYDTLQWGMAGCIQRGAWPRVALKSQLRIILFQVL